MLQIEVQLLVLYGSRFVSGGQIDQIFGDAKAHENDTHLSGAVPWESLDALVALESSSRVDHKYLRGYYL